MKVGAPFNPYKVFQGAFAPYWILEHRGIDTRRLSDPGGCDQWNDEHEFGSKAHSRLSPRG